MGPTTAWVDLDAIAHNVALLSGRAGVPVTAVVKSDGYGHGAVPVAHAALRGGARGLAVVSVEEGIELRTAGIGAPILVLGRAGPDEVEAGLRYDLRLTVFDRESLALVEQVASEHQLPAGVHVKLETGMGRLGFPVWEPAGLEQALAAVTSPAVRVEGVYTHLSSADEDPDYTREQLRRFDRSVSAFRSAGCRDLLVHAANSAGTLLFEEARYDTVRCGIAIYGLDPYPGAVEEFGLRPALSWTTRVAQVKTIPPGIGISYGHTFMPSEPMRVAVLPVGYADGYRRSLSNRGEVLLGGRRVPVRGRVCMNLIVVGEVGPEVRPGDPVVLLGSQGEESITATEMATWLDTIPYEVATSISGRVPRRYRGELAGATGPFPFTSGYPE